MAPPSIPFPPKLQATVRSLLGLPAVSREQRSLQLRESELSEGWKARSPALRGKDRSGRLYRPR
jgi:hypothetical protein